MVQKICIYSIIHKKKVCGLCTSEIKIRTKQKNIVLSLNNFCATLSEALINLLIEAAPNIFVLSDIYYEYNGL